MNCPASEQEWGILQVCAACKEPTTHYCPAPDIIVITQAHAMRIVTQPDQAVCISCLVKALTRSKDHPDYWAICENGDG